MRQEILDYIGDLNLGAFTTSQELPWDSSGTPLYVKNLKKIYVDRPEYTEETVIATLDGVTIENQTTSVRAFFACDAKALPPSYDDLVSDLRSVRDIDTVTGFSSRGCEITSRFEADVLVTELTYTFVKLI
jgi:hypothetical protein